MHLRQPWPAGIVHAIVLGAVLFLDAGCITSREEQEYHQHMQELRRAYDRGELSGEGYRQAVRELDYLRPSGSGYVRPP